MLKHIVIDGTKVEMRPEQILIVYIEISQPNFDTKRIIN
jgi:hypothetical protein